MDKKKVHIGIFRRVTPGTAQSTKEAFLEETQRAAEKVEYYYRWYCRNYWDVKVRAYVYEGTDHTYPPYYGFPDIQDYINANPELFKDFDPNYFHCWGGYKSGICGQGRVPGNKSVTYFSSQGSACGVKTMIHELGHNFGLWHASTKREGQDAVEYGDKTSTMGSVYQVTGLNGPNMIKLGTVEDREILNVEKSTQVLLAPIELSKYGMHPNEYQHVMFGKYHLSIRKAKGTYLPIKSGADREKRIYVHEFTRTNSVRHLDDLLPGAEKELPDGTVIRYEEYADEMARVSIIMDGIEPENISLPKELPPAPSTPGIKYEHMGLWYDPDFTGEGFHVFEKSGKVVVYWYTYHPDVAVRRYYFAQGTAEEFNKGVDLYTTRGGTWGDPASRKEVLVGKLQLYFFNRDVGIVNWHTTEHGRGSMQIQIASRGVSNTIQFDPARDGEGLTVLRVNAETTSALWYTYTETGLQNWYLCIGPQRSMTIYEAPNNTFMELRDDAGLVKVGIASLDYNMTNFNYEFADGRAGTLDLTKLF